MKYSDIASRLSNTFIAEVPGSEMVNSLILEFIEWKHRLTAGKEWVEYDGARLYADTSDHVAENIAIYGGHEPRVSGKIKNHLDVGDFAIDIGAHIGNHTVTMRRHVGSDGKVWAFEPNPQNVDYINKTLDGNGWENVELFPIALSDDESSDQLLVPNSGNTASAFLPDANTADADTVDSYTVETRQLTSILNERQIDKINLLKIDVEGGETTIIRDISPHLSDIETIVLEFHTQMLNEEDVRDVFGILKSRGQITDLKNNVLEVDRVLNEKTDIIWQSH